MATFIHPVPSLITRSLVCSYHASAPAFKILIRVFRGNPWLTFFLFASNSLSLPISPIDSFIENAIGLLLEANTQNRNDSVKKIDRAEGFDS